MNRIWEWLKAAFRRLFARERPVSKADIDRFLGVDQLIRSANICLASHGSTRRERLYAKRKIRRYAA